MRIWPLLVLGLTFLPAHAAAATRNFGIRSFEKIRVEGPYRVILKTGVAPFARAKGRRRRSTASTSRCAATCCSSAPAPSPSNPAPPRLPRSRSSSAPTTLIRRPDRIGKPRHRQGQGAEVRPLVHGAGTTEIAQVAVDQLSLNLGGNAAARLSARPNR